MIYQNDYFAMLSNDDYLKYRSSTSFNVASSADQVVDNTFFFNSFNQVLTAQSSATLPAGFNFFFPATSLGDIVEVECEIQSISGDLPQIFFTETSKANGTGVDASNVYDYRQPSQQGQWEVIKQSFVAKNITYNNYKVFVGITTANAGKYRIRNLKVKINRNVFNRKQEISRKYCITKYQDEWIYDNYTSSDIPNITVNNGNLNIGYDITFARRPIGLITFNNAVSLPFKYLVNADFGSAAIVFYDSTNNIVLESAMPNNTKFNLHILGEL